MRAGPAAYNRAMPILPIFLRSISGAVALAALAIPSFVDPVAAQAPAAAPASAAANEVTITFLGDSLTAGYGLDGDQAFPALIEKALRAEGSPVAVVNAGISGDTTAGGLSRVDWLLRRKPDILVVSLGANDGLRGLSLDASEKNLRTILEKGKAAGARVLLLGMMIPPNYGPEYIQRFAGIYPRLAKDLDIDLMPFLLEGVAGKRELNQADGLHPTAAGQEIVAKNVLIYLRPLVHQVAAAKKKQP